MREQGLAREEEGPLVSEWRGREHLGGRWRAADGASGLGLHTHAHAHRKRTGEGILQCIVRTSAGRTVLPLFLYHLELKFSRSFAPGLSGFFPVKMGTRDFVEWQVGSRRWG